MKSIWIALGILSLIAGFIGIFLPLLPTTPFALLAAFCFSKGSDSLHQWLLNSKLFGSIIQDWESNKVIRPKVKVTSTVMIVALFGYALACVKVVLWIKALVLLTGVLVLAFIWTRNSGPIKPILND